MRGDECARMDTKNMSVFKRAICLVAVVCMIIGIAARPVPAYADDYTIGGDWVTGNTQEIKHGDAGTWQSLTTGMKVDYGDQFRLRVDFKVPNDVQLQPGDVLRYQLPSGITYVSGQTYPMTDETGAQMGSYRIEGDQVVITYTGAESMSNITGFFTIDGAITSNTNGDNQGGETKFEFPGVGTITVDINARHDVKAVKNGAINVPGSADEFDFVIDVASVGENSNVHVTDTMGDALTLEDGTITIYTDPQCREPYKGTWNADTSTHGFTMTIANMADGETLYVKYRVKVDRERAISACLNNKCTQNGSNEYQLVNNTVKVTSHEDVSEESSEKGIWLTDLWNVYKNGTDSSDGTTSKITWTLTIMPGKDGIVDKATIKDTLGPNLVEPTRKPTVTCYTKQNPYYPPVDCGTIDWDALKKGEASLPKDGNDGYARYVITYETEVNDDGAAGTYTNTADVTPNDGTPQRTTTGEAHLQDPATITKTTSGTTSDHAHIAWQTEFTANRDLTDVEITDTLDRDSHGDNVGPFQTFDRDSVTIYTDREHRNRWNGTWSYKEQRDSGFTIAIPNVAKGTTLFIAYTSTPMTGHEHDTLHNTVAYGDKTSTATYTPPRDDNLKKEFAWSNYVSGTPRWKLIVTNVSPSATNVTITDTLPPFYAYVPQSLSVLQMDAWPYTALDGAQVRDNGDGTFTITLTPGSDAFKQAQTSTGIALEYNTRITDYHSALKAGNHLVNKAAITVDGATQTEVTADAWINPPAILDKKGTYDSSTAPNIDYAINVNKAGLTLNGGRTLTLTDTLGEALALRLDSVAIVDAKGAPVAGATYAYNPATRELTIRVPDATACTVTYKATVLLGEGASFNGAAANTVVLRGYEDAGGTKPTDQTGEVQHAQGGLSGDGHALQIFKYMDGDISSPRVGVRFTIEAVNGEKDADGTYVVSGTNADITALVATTMMSGYTQSAGLRADQVYRVTENKDDAEGFKPIDPFYIVFPGSGTDVSAKFGNGTIRDEDNTYQLTVATTDKGATLGSYVWICDNEHAMTATLKIGKTNLADIAISGAKLQLARLDGTVEDKWTSDGKLHEIGNLRPGIYVLSELEAPEGYQLADDIMIYVNADGTITVDGKNLADNDDPKKPTATVTMRDEPQTTQLRVHKIWDDENDVDGLRTDAVFDLYHKIGDNGEWELMSGQSRTIRADDTQGTAVWDNLPERSGDERVAYQVRERPIDGYESSSTVENGVYTFTNRHTPSRTQLKVRKVWKHYGHDEYARPLEVTVRLLANGEVVDDVPEVTLNADNDWAHTFADLPQYLHGARVVYSVRETVPEGYTASYALTTAADGTQEVTVTNTYTPTSEQVRFSKRDINGEEVPGARMQLSGTPDDGSTFETQEWTTILNDVKEFELAPGRYEWRELEAPSGYLPADPISFTVERGEDGQLTAKRDGAAIDGNTIVMTDAYRATQFQVSKRTLTNGADIAGARLRITGNLLDGTPINPIEWTTDGTRYDVSLLPGTYRLREVEAPAGYDRADDIDFTIHPGGAIEVDGLTNFEQHLIVVDKPKTTNVYFSKRELGALGELAGAHFTLSGTTFEGTHVETEWESGEEMHRFPMLDGQYTLTETKAPNGFEAVEPIEFTIADGRIIIDETLQQDTVLRVWNVRKPVTFVTVNKQWQDIADQDRKRPHHVTIQLLADGDAVGEPSTLNAANNWTYTWSDLPEQRDDGTTINYTVRESLDGEFGQEYHVFVGKRPWEDGTGYRVVNIHQPHAVQLELDKVWDDADNQDGKRPDTIDVSVWGTAKDNNGNDVTEQMVDLPQLAPDEDTGQWHWTLEGLPRNNIYGNPYSYTIKETLADGKVYQQVFDGKTCTEDAGCRASETDDGTAHYKLTNHHEPETIDIPVTKIWSDNNNANKRRPDKAVVWLLSSIDEGEGKGWPDSNGWPLPQYTFTQPAPNGSVAGDATFTPLDTVPGTTAPDMDGECVETWEGYGHSCLSLRQSNQTDADANLWTGTFTNVPKYHNGKEVHYLLTEQDVDCYKPTLEAVTAQPDTGTTEPGDGTADTGDGTTGATEGTGGTSTKPAFTLRNTELVELPSTGYSGPLTRPAIIAAAFTLIVMAGALALTILRTSREEEM